FLCYTLFLTTIKDDKLIFLYFCYYFLNPILKRESEQDKLLSRAELITIHVEVFREDTTIETNHVITPINAPSIREIYQEYLVAHTSNKRMMNWVTRARTLSQQINLEFNALRMLMFNHHSDNSIPIDESYDVAWRYIGLFIGQFEQPTSQVNSSHRYNILKNTFNPDTTFKFPGSGKRNLKFQINWLSRWKWLAYSVSCDGAFCKYCMLFCPKEVNTQKLGQLVFEKFSNWHCAVEKFNAHQKTNYHITATLKAHEFLSVFENKQESIAVKLDSKLKLEIEKNRKMMRPIIETILLCGRQGIALRGHTDSAPIDLSSLFLSNNEGNFRVILKYVLMNSKDELKNCFENLPKNSTYISPDIQNEIINTINCLVIKKLVTKINQAKCFTILADETTDVGGIEQFSMCVRYFDKDTNKIREDFLQFVPVTDMSGKSLAQVLLECLGNLGINLNYLRGQGYDGASAMRGLFNGVQAIIKQSYPLALYIHCCSHSLNLAISDACDVKSIRNSVGIIQTVCSFFNTPKRQAVLQNSVEQIAPDSKKNKLKMLCPTRWVERHEAILVFLELFDSIIDSLETISTWIDRETSSKASSILFSLKQRETLLSIHILAKVFSLSMPLSRQLQKADIDLSISMELADNVMSAACPLRTNAAEEFKIIYGDVEKKM
ncbi:zinc finger MYM-type protein 1-like, partial [Aphis craccivora]